MFNVCPNALLDDGLLDFTLLFGSPGKQVRKHASKQVQRTKMCLSLCLCLFLLDDGL
jgi:hypothetical protein